MTIYITTEPAMDIGEAGYPSGAGATAHFAAAFDRAARLVGDAAGVEIATYTGGCAQRAHDHEQGNSAAAAEVAVILWQYVHDAVSPGTGRGRWKVDRASARSTGAWLRRELADIAARGSQ